MIESVVLIKLIAALAVVLVGLAVPERRFLEYRQDGVTIKVDRETGKEYVVERGNTRWTEL